MTAHGLWGKSLCNTASVAAASSAVPSFAAAAAATAGSTSAIDREGDGATRKEDLQTLSTWTSPPPLESGSARILHLPQDHTLDAPALGSLAAVGVALAVSARAAPRQIALETPGPSDVLLASFPKSGNDWARFLVGRLLAARARRRRRPRLPQRRGRRPLPLEARLRRVSRTRPSLVHKVAGELLM